MSSTPRSQDTNSPRDKIRENNIVVSKPGSVPNTAAWVTSYQKKPGGHDNHI